MLLFFHPIYQHMWKCWSRYTLNIVSILDMSQICCSLFGLFIGVRQIHHQMHDLNVLTNPFYFKEWLNVQEEMVYHQTGYIPIFPLQSHSLVHRKKNSYLVVIQPLLDQDLIKLFLWWYLFSTCYFRRYQVLWDTYVIYVRYEIINYFIFVSVIIDFWSDYISQSF